MAKPLFPVIRPVDVSAPPVVVNPPPVARSVAPEVVRVVTPETAPASVMPLLLLSMPPALVMPVVVVDPVVRRFVI